MKGPLRTVARLFMETDNTSITVLKFLVMKAANHSVSNVAMSY